MLQIRDKSRYSLPMYKVFSVILRRNRDEAMKNLTLSLLLVLLLAACTAGGNGGGLFGKGAATAADTLTIDYAQGFQLHYLPGGCLVDISDPEREQATEYHFALMGEGADLAQVPEAYTVIRTPVRSAICMTTLQLAGFIKLDRLDCVVGITSSRHLFNEEIKARVKEGSITKIGKEGNFDPEVVIALDPEVILISPFKRGGYDALTDVQIPLIPHLGYKELTPLGQAEWIKFVGLLIGEEQRADSIFQDIAARYNDLRLL